MNHALERSFQFAGLEPTQHQTLQLAELRDWLGSEATKSGAIGPLESSRVDGRHLADSIIYSSAWETPPAQCWDLGSGAGLPGLVLAIVWPSCRLALIDRSLRKVELARRGARVVGLEVETRPSRIEDLDGPAEAIVSRAAMPAVTLRPHLVRLLAAGGLAVVSGTGSPVPGYENIEVPDGILDHSPRLLMMRNT